MMRPCAPRLLLDLGPLAPGSMVDSSSRAAPWTRLRGTGILADRGAISAAILKIPIPAARRARDPRRSIRCNGACEHNLRNLDVEIPLGLVRRRLPACPGSGSPTLNRGHSPPLARAAFLSAREYSRCPQVDLRARAHRQGHRHRPESHRSHASFEPCDLHRPLHAHPRAVRRVALRRRFADTGRDGSRST
jgi:hypothetical protein